MKDPARQLLCHVKSDGELVAITAASQSLERLKFCPVCRRRFLFPGPKLGHPIPKHMRDDGTDCPAAGSCTGRAADTMRTWEIHARARIRLAEDGGDRVLEGEDLLIVETQTGKKYRQWEEVNTFAVDDPEGEAFRLWQAFREIVRTAP